MVGLLNAPPQTQLWQRLRRKGRLEAESTGNNTSAAPNFKPKLNPRLKRWATDFVLFRNGLSNWSRTNSQHQPPNSLGMPDVARDLLVLQALLPDLDHPGGLRHQTQAVPQASIAASDKSTPPRNILSSYTRRT